MNRTLTYNDFADAAISLNTTIAAIKTVAEIESSGSGFLSNGLPKILFERHYFHRLTKGKFDNYSDISNSKPGGYTNNEWTRLEKAIKLDETAALSSASWGQFQIMGANYKLCSYSSVKEFTDDIKKDIKNHLKAFVLFIKNNKQLHISLIKRDWKTFARIYNGPNYIKNKYDTKLKNAYVKHENNERDLIKKVQTELFRLGYKTVGVIDGINGNNTRNAIIMYQKDHNLEQHGNIDSILLDSLFKK